MQFFKNKKWLLTGVLVALTTVAAFYFLRTRQTKPSPTPPPTGAAYKKLAPGISTETDIKNGLGDPIKETLQGTQMVLEYKSKNPNFNDEFSLASGTLTFIRQIVTLSDNIKISDMEKKYGSYQYLLYGPSSVNGFNLYIYPDKGVAYIGQQESGLITEVWYFAPTDINSFKINFASGYSDSFQPKQ